MAHEIAVAIGQDLIASAEPHAAARRLDKSLVHGVTWTGGIKGVTLLLSWLSTIIVARLLSPDDYGLVAMATVYLGLTTMITDFGLGSAIVALRDWNEKLAAQLHVVAALVGIVAFFISCAVAVPLSRFFGTTALAPVVIVLSSSLVLDSLRTVPIAILGRQLRFKYLSLLEGSKVLIAVAFTLVLATAGAAYWALVLGNVAASLVITVFVLATLPQRWERPRFAVLKSALGFSSNFLIGQLAWYGYSNADFVVAGRVLGRMALGQYTMAWTLTSAPADKIMAVFGRVMPTMVAAAQRDRDALRRYFLLFTELLAILIIPVSTGLALVAPDFVHLIFGAKWAASVVPLQILAVYTAIHILGTPTTPVLQVSGHASFPARCGLATLAILPPAFYFAGSRWGTLGIATIWLSVYPLILIPVFVKTFKTLRIRFADYIRCLAPTLVSAFAMALVVIAIRMFAPVTWPLVARFTSQVICGAIVFIASSFAIQQRRLGLLAEFVRSIRS